MVSHVCVLPAVGWTKVISTFMYGDIMYYIHHTPVFDMNYDNLYENKDIKYTKENIIDLVNSLLSDG